MLSSIIIGLFFIVSTVNSADCFTKDGSGCLSGKGTCSGDMTVSGVT
ncbi:Hypothetical protein EIN_482600, partial [Entamoeba invadens IP1]